MRTACVLLCLACIAPTMAADPDWQPVLSEVLKNEKTGFGGLCGVIVDHQSGDVWVNLSDRGMFHSRDQGQAMKGIGGLSWIEYDPQHETLYLMKMGSDLFRLAHKK